MENEPLKPAAPVYACPVPALWREVAGGLTPADETIVHLDHASRCNHCGPLLRSAVSEVSALHGVVTESERKRIASLESARERWQRKLAQRIAGTRATEAKPAPWGRRWLALPALALAGASVLAVIGVAAWFEAHRNQPAAAEQLLAKAYTEKRTLQLRIAGAEYAPVRVSRGPVTSFIGRPAPLLQAEALIATQLQAQPADPAWLRARAQADVLEGRYDAAVEALRHALQAQPNSPAVLSDVLTDLATAYFQRGLEADRGQDFGAAYEYLSQALKVSPEDSVALFNRAIVSEQLFLYRQAVDDWDHYLRLDSHSRWAEEARTRADAVRKKLQEHGGKIAPLLSPAQVARADQSPDASAEIESRIEEYQHQAIVLWLPQAFPESKSREAVVAADSSAETALFFLAELSRREHSDPWLSDLLRGSSSPDFPRAAAALARAVRADDGGDYDDARVQDDLAEKLFTASGNSAGDLRAQFEKTFITQIERHSDQCVRQAAAALPVAERLHYSWLQIQFGLEKGACSGILGDIGSDQRTVQRALDEARENRYGALLLRATGFLADDKFDLGDRATGSKLARDGLRGYWSAPYPVMRGYNLYTELAYNAESMGRSTLRTAFWREAVALIDASDDSSNDLLLRALAHNELADAATAAKLPAIAGREYAEAARLYAAAPPTDASRSAALAVEIKSARLEAQQGRAEEAIARLNRLREQIPGLSNDYLAQSFYSTLGELEVRANHAAEAERALRPALALAERTLATLTSDAERAQWSRDAAPAYLALIEAELVQGRSQDALDAYEWYLGVPQRQKAADASLRQPAIAARLPLLTRETVLVYAVLPDGLAIWEYDDRGVNSRWIPQSTIALQELVERFGDLTSDPRSELGAVRGVARSLQKYLIAPVEAHLDPRRTLVIEAQGWLADVPFEALLDAEGRYLIEKAPIVYSRGQVSQARLRGGAGIAPGVSALVVGSSASSQVEGLVPLPEAMAEADNAARHFDSPRLLKGGQASLAAVRKALPAAVVFHFAGHSFATPDKAGLLLGNGAGLPEGNLLDAAELRHVSLAHLQLAVLSSCNAAGGDESSRGFNDISDAFLRAGVPHVVASRWAVDSVESRVFAEDFYNSLFSGAAVSEAMRSTSRKMLANPETSHPYYWAAFAAYGRR